MKLTEFKALTFDCYGTLIDWETGIWNALQPLMSERRLEFNREEALDAFGRHEKEQEEETPSLRYSSLLAVVHARLAKNWGAHIFADLNDRFGASVAEWPAFIDTADALAYLKRHYKLVILSNVDRASFSASNKKLGVTFDAIYTAEDIGSYKPDPRNFAYLVEHMETDLGIRRSEILHTAQSLRHDHVPAEKARLARAWIDRRFDKKGAGATLRPVRPPKLDFHFKSLAELVEAYRVEAAR
ncbi:MAG: haloacid dehalogenase type II [Hyphomicrobiales bacterium]|nr:haloacid dehalogenase type II [Hyphomicrobiales bacterium]